MHSRQLHAVLTQLAEEAAIRLQAHVASGEEVPFELDSRSGRRGSSPLYCYRPLTCPYIAERFPLLRALPMYRLAVAQLEAFEGLDRYLLARGADPRRQGPFGRSDMAALVFLQDVFEEQTDFHVRSERIERALAHLDGSALAQPADVTIVATLHGIAISSPELPLTHGLLIAQPEALDGAPEQTLGLSDDCLLVVCTAHDHHSVGVAHHDSVGIVHHDSGFGHRSGAGVEHKTQVIADLLRALRLYGDGRIALGPLAWRRVADGPWSAFALGAGGHPHGALLVAADQEDELRAFCNLVSRRAPQEGPLAWALHRFELGCERSSEYDALSDHLLALHALLGGPSEAEPEGPSNRLLAARLAALCATQEHRSALTERTLDALALERAIVSGTAVEHAGGLELVRGLADNLRALLRDVICGHLPTDVAALADEILLAGDSLGAEMARDASEPSEILDVAV